MLMTVPLLLDELGGCLGSSEAGATIWQHSGGRQMSGAADGDGGRRDIRIDCGGRLQQRQFEQQPAKGERYQRSQSAAAANAKAAGPGVAWYR